MPLAVVTRSGSTPSCSQANQSPVRQKPVWISSATNTAPAAVAHAGERRQEAGRRHDEAALALDRLDQHARPRSSAPTCFSIMSMARAAASAPDSPPSRSGYDIGTR